jgi:hypothetical protein
MLSTPQELAVRRRWSRTVSGIPSGYNENWDGKIDLAPVAVEPQTWDKVKDMYK